MDKPEWLQYTEDLLPILMEYFNINLQEISHIEDPHLTMMPYCASLHWYAAIESSIDANLQGRHAIAVCLIRQCLEAQSLVALGLVKSKNSEQKLRQWNSGKITHGEIRRYLEQKVWPHFQSKGLWGEEWSDYYATINRAVQEYAHYTPSLMGWQWRDICPADEPHTRMMAISIAAYDSIKASRITAFHSILVWTMGKIISIFRLSNSNILNVLEEKTYLLESGLAKCNLLWPKSNWEAQFAPHMFIEEDNDDYQIS